jgi:hypothetical protein
MSRCEPLVYVEESEAGCHKHIGALGVALLAVSTNVVACLWSVAFRLASPARITGTVWLALARGVGGCKGRELGLDIFKCPIIVSSLVVIKVVGRRRAVHRA